MSIDSINAAVLGSLCQSFSLQKRGINDYCVNTPFLFSDGDMLKIILKEAPDGSFLLTDEGHTLMALSYHDFEISNSDTRQTILEKILTSHVMFNRDGRLVMPVKTVSDLGPSVFTFAQGLMKVADMGMWKREHTKSLFWEHFMRAISEIVGNREYHFKYSDPEIDPNAEYPIDCFIAGENHRNFHIYVASSDSKAKDSIISIYYYNKKNVSNASCVVFDLESDISRRTCNRVADVADKTFSSLGVLPEYLPNYLSRYEML